MPTARYSRTDNSRSVQPLGSTCRTDRIHISRDKREPQGPLLQRRAEQQRAPGEQTAYRRPLIRRSGSPVRSRSVIGNLLGKTPVLWPGALSERTHALPQRSTAWTGSFICGDFRRVAAWSMLASASDRRAPHQTDELTGGRRWRRSRVRPAKPDQEMVVRRGQCRLPRRRLPGRHCCPGTG